MDENSILTSIKKLLGYSEEQTSFDLDIKIHINSVFSDLHEIGVGPTDVFSIDDKNDIWDDFIQNKLNIKNVITYVYLRVKLLFDPPSNSTVISSYERTIDKLEWRLQVASESSKTNSEEI